VEADDNSFFSRQAALVECMTKLQSQDRELLRMRYHKQLKPKSIAESINRSVHSVYRSLARLHRILADCVKKSLVGDC